MSDLTITRESATITMNISRNRIVYAEPRFALMTSGVYGVSSAFDSKTIIPHPNTIRRNDARSYFHTNFSFRNLIAKILLKTIDKHDVVDSKTRSQ